MIKAIIKIILLDILICIIFLELINKTSIDAIIRPNKIGLFIAYSINLFYFQHIFLFINSTIPTSITNKLFVINIWIHFLKNTPIL